MAHVFDYSTSTAGMHGYSLTNLFGVHSGNFLPAEFWRPLGTLQGVVSYYYEDFDSQGNRVQQEGSFRMHLDGYGSYVSQQLSPVGEIYFPRFWSRDPAIDASQAFFTGASQLTLLAGSEGFLRIEGLPTLSRSFGALPSRTFADSGLADEYVQAAVVAANQSHLARLQAILPASLASGGRVVAENFGPDPIAGTVRLVYTPDNSTRVTYGDWIQLDPSESRDAYTAQLHDTRALFADEDVTVILTDASDSLHDTASGFAARNLRIYAGDGDDSISVTGDDYFGWGESSFGSVPLHIFVDGGAGDDNITIMVKGTATVHGGSGNDFIVAQEMTRSPAGYFEAHGGDGDDYIRGIDNGTNLIYGDDGNDTLIGGFDSIDTIYGGADDDYITAGSWWDSFRGWNIYSEAPNTFHGGDGNDTIFGGAGDDVIHGGNGDDWIMGGRGNDVLVGGPGLDTYSLSVGNPGEIALPYGDTRIIDDGGVIEFAAWMAAGLDLSALARIGNDLVIGTPGHSSLRLVGYYRDPAAWSTSGSEGFIDFAAAATLTGPPTLPAVRLRGLRCRRGCRTERSSRPARPTRRDCSPSPWQTTPNSG